MATSPASVVASTALDTAGLSVVTAAVSAANPRLGSIYNPAGLAAAQPLWFHPLKDGRHLMVMARWWTGATPGGGIGTYSAFTEHTAPSWIAVSGSAGTATALHDGTAIPLRTPVDSAVVTAAASRPPDLMWLLHAVAVGASARAVIQLFNVAPGGTVTVGGEEVLPQTDAVVFNKGLQYATPFLLVYGTDAAGNIYRIRKAWSRIGYNNVSRVFKTESPMPGATWEYYTGTGWSANVADLAPVQSGFISAGPMSFGYYRTLIVASTVVKTATAYTGRIWASNAGRPWSPLASTTPLPLGDSAAGTYLGGGVALQSQVGAAPSALGAGVNAGIPYLTSVKVLSGGDSSLLNTWGVWPIQLVG